MDLATQVHPKFTAQLESWVRDLEASMYCTVFLPNEIEIVKFMHIAGRHHSDMAEKTRHGRRKSANLVFQRDAASHREDSQGQVGRLQSAGPGEGGGPEDAQDDHRRSEIPRAECVGQIMQASPNFRQAGAGTQVADHRRDRRIHHTQMEDADLTVARELSKAFFHQRKAREEGRERSNRLSPIDLAC